MELRTELENINSVILSVQENNEDARDYAYQKFSPLIHKEINRFKKRALALGIDISDLSQEAMLGFSYALNNFKDDEEAKFITFATLCIRRRLMNYTEKFETAKCKIMHDSLALDSTFEDDKSIGETIEGGTDPLRDIITSETLLEVSKTFKEKLSENEKTAILYDLEGRSVEEIAELMNMTPKQIYNLVFRARKKLKL